MESPKSLSRLANWLNVSFEKTCNCATAVLGKWLHGGFGEVRHLFFGYIFVILVAQAVKVATWMSRTGSERIKGDRISGLVHPKEYPNYK